MKRIHHAAAGLALAVLSTLLGAEAERGRERRLTKEDVHEIAVVVTALSGDDVYLDRGRQDGVRPGDLLRLLPPGHSPVFGRVKTVSRTSARARLGRADSGTEIGTNGVVYVPASRVPKPPPPPPEAEPEPEPPPPAFAQPVPDHPPWEQAPESWDEELPLLAPVGARPSEERPMRVRGRAFAEVSGTRDSGSSDQSYVSSIDGLSLDIENPFHRGGALDIDLLYILRSANLEESSDVADTDFIPSRLSYRTSKGERHTEYFQIGRFLQEEISGFGVLDGVQWLHRTSGGHRVGASVGYMPDSSDSMKTGDDLQVALLGRWIGDEDENLSAGLGYQKSWHEGEADRDLLIGDVVWHAARWAHLLASVWVDFYDSSDDLKDPGFELTQLFVNGTTTWRRGGVGLFTTRTRFPQTLRNELPATNAQELADEEVARYGVNAWTKVTNSLRLNGRVDRWEEDDDSGGGAEVGFRLRDVVFGKGEVGASVFSENGEFSDGRGVRTSIRRPVGKGSLNVSFDVTDFDQEDVSGTQTSVTQQRLFVLYQRAVGRYWDLSAYVESHWREDQDSVTLGFRLERSF